MTILHRNPASVGRRPRPAVAGFTLIELMVVIAIIAILSSIFLGATAQADRASKIARTKSLISKLNNMLMARWDAYRTMRLPINVEMKGTTGDSTLINAMSDSVRFRQNVARRRMFAMRELLRMEMPDRYEDLDDPKSGYTSNPFNPVVLVQPTQSSGGGVALRPGLWNTYRRRILQGQTTYSQNSGQSLSASAYWQMIAVEYQSAECLYMIITSGVDDSSVASEHITATDWGDKDKDGMPELQDAWGNPIEFLRWAPGIISPAQPMHSYPTSDLRGQLFNQSSQPQDPNNNNNILSHWTVQYNTIYDIQSGQSKTKLVVIDQNDPFNPMQVGPQAETATAGQTPTHQAGVSRWQPGDPWPEYGFVLMPYIYSYGPDLQDGVDHCYAYSISYSPTSSSVPTGVQYSDPYNLYKGAYGAYFRGSQSLRSAGVPDGYNLDNIDNHSMLLR